MQSGRPIFFAGLTPATPDLDACRAAFRSRFDDAHARFDEPLAPYLAYRIGGPADILVFPRDEADLEWIAATAREHRVPITVIGTGTNLLVADDGLRGIVVSLLHSFRQIERVATPDAGRVRIRCGGGVEKPALLNWAIEHGLTGLEFSSGVPGTIGGGIFMNAGTKYGCYADILKELRLFRFDRGFETHTRESLYFGYREQTAVGDGLVTSVVFELTPGDGRAIQREVERIIAERAEKQPLDFPSCGSTFKNPPGHSAGRLIERAGLKGLRVGGAEVSTKHANFILNKGGARASDILSLIAMIRKRVWAEFQVTLECEVIVLGEREPQPEEHP
jgi:UDP-N-acetylmuramate dehydrogenase